MNMDGSLDAPTQFAEAEIGIRLSWKDVENTSGFVFEYLSNGGKLRRSIARAQNISHWWY